MDYAPPPTHHPGSPPSPGETGGNQKGPAWPLAPPTHHPGSPQAKTQAGPAQDPLWTPEC